MRTIKYLILGLIGLCLVVIGFANRGAVTLTLLPDEFVPFTGFNLQITLPIYLVVFGGIVVGLLLGFFWEWMREHKHRREAVVNRREKAVLATEVKKLKSDRNDGKDDVLALLEDGHTAR
ncbi:LapA family protein [Pseudoruegeria sp. SK021]|uniref:LapA family protein n=1 Tax=Pseudoruegeria sp. SK021 TaxID=1933035 RepID=UPI000A22FB35|nr:LapA family protein [Pseudoruegeria sp. SK021]OSP56546.1 DUF1049 domain-containing protein [Pseudoruegeria sp. SK021]